MFEISFPELIILAVVALLVLGPERLPRAAQFAGLWVRRARAHWHAVKSEFERELADEELRRSLAATREAMQDAETALRDGIARADAVGREALAAPAAAEPTTATDAAAPDDRTPGPADAHDA